MVSNTIGSFQISHLARVVIEVADGLVRNCIQAQVVKKLQQVLNISFLGHRHTVLWETPVTVSPCTAAQARSLSEVYPDYLTLEVSNASSFAASTAEMEEASRELLVKAAEMVNSGMVHEAS